jgi:hypothetical protein
MLAILAGGHFVSLQAAAIIQLRVIEGEGAVYAPGSRATRGITVQVTDETGQPLEGVAVSFRLPEEGAGGTFASGLRTEIVTTRGDGRATVWGMRWNRTPGPFEVRVTAAKDQARAGIVIAQFLSDRAAGAGGSGEFHASHSYKKWLLVGAALGAGALGGMLVAARKGQEPASTSATEPPVIGAPSIIIGTHP